MWSYLTYINLLVCWFIYFFPWWTSCRFFLHHQDIVQARLTISWMILHLVWMVKNKWLLAKMMRIWSLAPQIHQLVVIRWTTRVLTFRGTSISDIEQGFLLQSMLFYFLHFQLSILFTYAFRSLSSPLLAIRLQSSTCMYFLSSELLIIFVIISYACIN